MSPPFQSVAWCLNQLIERFFLRRQLPVMVSLVNVCWRGARRLSSAPAPSQIDGSFLEYLVSFCMTAQGGIQVRHPYLKF